MDCDTVEQLIYLLDSLDKSGAISNDVAVAFALDLWSYGLEQDCQFAREAFGLPDSAAEAGGESDA